MFAICFITEISPGALVKIIIFLERFKTFRQSNCKMTGFLTKFPCRWWFIFHAGDKKIQSWFYRMKKSIYFWKFRYFIIIIVLLYRGIVSKIKPGYVLWTSCCFCFLFCFPHFKKWKTDPEIFWYIIDRADMIQVYWFKAPKTLT